MTDGLEPLGVKRFEVVVSLTSLAIGPDKLTAFRLVDLKLLMKFLKTLAATLAVP